MSEIWNKVIEVVDSYAGGGERRLETGTRLVCPAPDIAPLAWLHVLFPGLNEGEVASLEVALRCNFPADYRDFLMHTNGIFLFAYRTKIFGIRHGYSRTGDEAWQPHDLIHHNGKYEVPNGTPESHFYFGSTCFGGKWCFFDSRVKPAKVGITDRKLYQPELIFYNFSDWLVFELESGDDLNSQRRLAMPNSQ